MFEIISNLYQEKIPTEPAGHRKEINPKMVLTAGAVGVASLYALMYLVEFLISPLLFLTSLVILAHIWIRPEKSLLMAKNILNQSPDAIMAAVQNFPDLCIKTGEISHRIYQKSLQSIGDLVIDKPKEEPHTFAEVATSVATQGIQYTKETYQTLRPQVAQLIESGLQSTENAIYSAKEYVTETILPSVKEKFNETFPSR